MGRKPNPTIIGAFVVGALALGLLGLLVFGSGRYFRSTNQYVVYFPGSVNGLSVGAPVKFRGVDIGTVTNIELVFGPENGHTGVRIPVYVETDPRNVKRDGEVLNMRDPEVQQRLVAAGLRAQLQTQSLVTGLLYVQLDFFPDTAVTYVLPQPSDPVEIPAIPTALEEASSAAREIIDELRSVKFGPMVQQASEALQGINAIVNSPSVKATIDELPTTIKQLNQTIADARGLLSRVDQQVTPLAGELDATLESVQRTLASVEQTVASAGTLIAPGSPLDYDLRNTLQDVGRAAQAIQYLADYLERDPTALIYGKPTTETQTP